MPSATPTDVLAKGRRLMLSMDADGYFNLLARKGTASRIARLIGAGKREIAKPGVSRHDVAVGGHTRDVPMRAHALL